MSILKTQYKPVSREQFKLLREAKQLVKQEFSEDLALQDDAVLDKIYEYALRSDGEGLFELFSELTREAEYVSPNNEAKEKPSHSLSMKKIDLNAISQVKVGDVVNGARCVSMYRGKPVFEPA